MPMPILDTSVYIDRWEHGLHQDTLEDVKRAYLIRHSAVVHRNFGAALVAERPSGSLPPFMSWRRFDGSLRWPTGGKPAGLFEASVTNKAGTYISAVTSKRRADGAHSATVGATVVTTNSADFELLRSDLRISVLPAR
jgi:hypothetical protein